MSNVTIQQKDSATGKVTEQISTGGAAHAYDATLRAGEDQTNDVLVIENGQFTHSKVIADAQIKGSAGFLHTVTFTSEDAVPTAGTIIVYDSLTETGTEILQQYITAAAFNGFSLTLDVVFTTGLYIGFTTTGDVGVTVSYR